MAENAVVVGNVSSLAEIEAAQIDQQIATAKRYPRDEVEAVNKSIRLATYNVKIAQSCIYSRPVGKKDGRQTFASGPSIRLAEVLKSSWGNLRCGTRVVGERDGQVFVQAVCHDLEANVFETCEEGKRITRADGSRYSDGQVAVTIAAVSKIALRNVIFSVVPKAYAEQIMEACKDHIVGNDREELYSQIIANFAKMGVDEARVISAIDRRDYPAGSNEEVVFLIGLNNAIKDGLCSVEDVFGPAPKVNPIEAPTKKKAEPQKTNGNGPKTEAKGKATQSTPEQGAQAQPSNTATPAAESEQPRPDLRTEFELGFRATLQEKYQGAALQKAAAEILEQFGYASLGQVHPAKFTEVVLAAAKKVQG
jgi:hypothetical protein